MLGRSHVSFRGLGHSPRQLVDRVEDVVAGDLCEVHHGSSNHLVASLLLRVQQPLLRLVWGQFQPYFRGVRGVTAFHAVVLYHVLRVVFLVDGDSLFLTVAGEVRAENSRHVSHVGHLEPVRQLLVELVKPSLAGAEEHNVVHIERKWCSENWWGVRAAWGRGEKSGRDVSWTISELSALTPISRRLQPRTRGNGAGRRNK